MNMKFKTKVQRAHKDEKFKRCSIPVWLSELWELDIGDTLIWEWDKNNMDEVKVRKLKKEE